MTKNPGLFRRLTGAVLVAAVILFTLFSKNLLTVRELYISISILFGAHLVTYVALSENSVMDSMKMSWGANVYGKIRLSSVVAVVVAVAAQFISLYIGAPIEVVVGALSVVIGAVVIWFISGVIEEYGQIPGILTRTGE